MLPGGVSGWWVVVWGFGGIGEEGTFGRKGRWTERWRVGGGVRNVER